MNRTIRILLADCDAEFRQKLASALIEEGIEADMAANRADLFEKLPSHESLYTLTVIGQFDQPEEHTQVVSEVQRQYPQNDIITLTGSQDAWHTEWVAGRLVRCTADRDANAKVLAHTIRSTVWQRLERSRSQTLQSLLSASEPIGPIKNQDQLYQQLYEEAMALLPGLDAFVVAHNDEQSDEISFPFAYKHETRLHIPSRIRGNGLAEYVLMTKHSLLLHYGDEMLRMQLGLDAPNRSLGHFKSEIVVPMFIEENKVHGIFFAGTENPSIHYTREHEQILSTLASKAASAFRHDNEIKEAVQLRDAIAAVAKQRLREGVLRAIVEGAHKIVNSSFTGLILLEEDGSLHKVGLVVPEDFHEKFAEARQEGGLTRAVIDSRRPIRIPDTSKNNLVKDSVREAGIKSMLVLPLIHDDRVLGVLYTHTFTYRSFADRDVELWSAFATQAAGALDRVIEEERQILDYKRLIHELDRLDEHLSLPETLERVATVAKLVFRSDTCRLFFIDSPTGSIVSSAWASGDALEYHVESEPRPHGSTRFVLDTRQPFYFPDMKEGPSQRAELLNAGLKSSVSLPLRYGTRDIGVLHCNYFTRRMNFNEHFQTQLEAFGARAAVAIHRAARERKAEIWHGLDREIVNCTEVRQLYQLLTDKAQEALRADFALFYPYDPSTSDSARLPLKDQVVLAGHLNTPWRAPRGGRGGGVFRELARHSRLIRNNPDPKKFSSRIAKREGVKAFVALRLEVPIPDARKPRLVGILFVNYRHRTHLTESDLAELHAAGELIASGIQRLRLQKEVQQAFQQRNRQLRAVIEIFRVHETSMADLNLDHIAEQAARALELDTCSILEFDPDSHRFTDRGNFGFMNSQHINAVLRPKFEQEYMRKDGPIVIPDLRKDPFMRTSLFVRREGIRSTIVSALRAEGQLLGLIFGNYRKLTQPSPEEQDAFVLFAAVAAHVLQSFNNASKFNESQLKEERRRLLVWVSMVEDMWQHTLVLKASSIRNQAYTLLKQLRQPKALPNVMDSVPDVLDEIYRLAADIANAPPRVPLESEMQKELIPIGPLLLEFAARERRSNSLRNDTRHSIEVNTKRLGGVQIFGYRRWLIYTLESVFQNAYKAMPKGGQISIHGNRQRQWIEIRIQDTGKGVPRRLQDKIFKQAMTGQRKHSGLGIGSVLATTLMEETGGTIELEKPGPGNTTVLLRLPIVKQAKRQ